LFEQALAIFQQHYLAHVSDLSRPFAGVVAGLARLKARGFHLACITNKAEAFTLPLLRNLDLYKYFELVLVRRLLAETEARPVAAAACLQALWHYPGPWDSCRRFEQRRRGGACRRHACYLRALWI